MVRAVHRRPGAADGRAEGGACPRWPRSRRATPIRCTTRTASPPPAGCCWRSPARPPSTGSPASPPGWSAPATPRSRSSPTRTSSSAATGCRRASSVARRCSPARCRRSPSARAARSTCPAAARATSGSPTCPPSPPARCGAYLGAPLIAASGHVVGVLAVYDPVPRPGPTTPRSCWTSSRVGGGRARALRRPVGRRHLPGPPGRGAGGQLGRHLGGRTCAAASSTGTSGARRSSASRARSSHADGPAVRRARPPRRPGAGAGGHAGGDRGPRRSTPSSCASCAPTARSAGRSPAAGSWSTRDGEPVRILGTVARRHRRPGPGRRRGCRPSSGPRRSPRWPPRLAERRRASTQLADITLRGAQVLGRRVRRRRRPRPARRHAARAPGPPAHRRRRRRETHEPVPAGGRRDRARRRAAHPVRRPHGRAGAAGRPAEAAARGSRGWPRSTEVLGHPGARLPAAAGRGPAAGQLRGLLDAPTTPSATRTSSCSRR